ncbi:TonB-dependent receptor [Candidatus Methylobacter oryzae]|uniref:TonB-dependent receptor n=2 Tax=Candidatus Methylobacter oryzae TaxID=2497749 RepID=A0ABY3CA76_9GAMM|nr:TonB-dependent receptor [Candidatus Methylobacter oryzae]
MLSASTKLKLCLSALLLSLNCHAENQQSIDTLTSEDLLAMSLEQVMALSITTSVSKKEQNVKDSAAAVFVISAEDIRRSGATNIPEALRMAPGLQVARVNASQWAVTIRGLNDRAANKLLVLMDGRTLFFPGFSGTLWETLDMLMENIERIEVIRGPGATLWGANAVNGVINIISKNAKKTQGTQLSIAGGDEQVFGSARYGFQIDAHSFGRIHAQGKKHDSYRNTNGTDAYDGWDAQQGGVQLDLSDGDDDAVKIQSNFSRGRFDNQQTAPRLTAPYFPAVRSQQDSNMFSLLSRWDKTLSADSSFSLQAYYDYQQHEFYLPSTFHQFDLDSQYRLKLFDRHDLILGGGYRFIQDQFNNNAIFQFSPGSLDYKLYNGFIQDEITLVPEKLKFILGTKLEHNDFSGLQFLPNTRLIWSPDNNHSVWTALSKAGTTPARSKEEMDIWLTTVPASAQTGNMPVKVFGQSSFMRDRYKSEEVIAYELGYRFQTSKVSADLALFYNDYSRLPFIISAGSPSVTVSESGIPYILQPVSLINDVRGYTYGSELSGAWQATDYWKLNLTYGFLEERYKTSSGNLNRPVYGTPQNQFSLRSSFDILSNLELDFWLRYVDKLADVGEKPVSDYTSLNLRLAYRPVRNLELSVVGDNLIEPHVEFNPDIQLGDYQQTLLSRHFYLKAKLDL